MDALITLIISLFNAGVQAVREGNEQSIPARAQNLVNEWARKQVADPEFDKRYGDGSEPTA